MPFILFLFKFYRDNHLILISGYLVSEIFCPSSSLFFSFGEIWGQYASQEFVWIMLVFTKHLSLKLSIYIRNTLFRVVPLLRLSDTGKYFGATFQTIDEKRGCWMIFNFFTYSTLLPFLTYGLFQLFASAAKLLSHIIRDQF